MRKRICILYLLLAASCATVIRPAASELVGKWQYADEMQTCRFIFRGNGTFGGNTTAGGVLLSQFRGRWTLQANNILYEYTNDAVGRIPTGTKDRDTLVAITKDYFVIEAADGSRRKYVRVG